MADVVTIECDEEEEEEDGDKEPYEKQVIQPQNLIPEPEDEKCRCILTEKTQILFKGDKKLAEAIRKESRSKNMPRINWPTRDVKPISEYIDTKIFCLAFPWLFPGGTGDTKEC